MELAEPSIEKDSSGDMAKASYVLEIAIIGF
jgi:hypothetical protein